MLLPFILSLKIPFTIFVVPTFVVLIEIVSVMRFVFSMRKYKYSGEYTKMVQELCKKGDITMPRLYKKNIENYGALSFGFGPFSSICLTDEVMELKTEKIMKGVLAHELAHVKYSHSITLMVTVDILVAFQFEVAYALRLFDPTNVVIFSLLSAIPAALIYMAVARNCERQADQFVRDTMGYADGLKDFLFEYQNKYIKMGIKNQKATLFKKMLSSHPTIDERVTFLEAKKINQ